MLVPYDGVRYYLKEWLRQGVYKSRHMRKLFKVMHASLRKAVEKLFGILKGIFQVVRCKNEHSIERQIDLVVLAAVFSFIAWRYTQDQAFDI